LKILGRFFYAIVVSVLFLWVLDYSNGLMTSLYFDKYGTAALAVDNPDYFFFYSAIPDFEKSEPVLAFDNADFALRVYEVATATETEGTLTVSEYVYILIHDKNGTLSGDYSLRLSTEGAEPETVVIGVVQFRTLPIYVAVNETGYVYIAKSTLTSLAFTRFALKDSAETVVFEGSGSIAADDFTIQAKLTEYFTANDALPGLELQADGIFPNNPHLVTEYQYIFWVAVGGYFVLVAIVTYFVFFFRKKYLGKQAPSSLLQKETGNQAAGSKPL
jgi:hypothetical protein